MPTNQQGEAQNPVSRQVQHEIDIPSAIVLRGSASLRQLRDRVQAVVKELERLREKNQKLTRQIAKLKAGPDSDPNTSTVIFEGDREQILNNVNMFIKTIDNYLNMDAERSN